VNTVSPSTPCAGDPGELDAEGVPANLPTRVQLGGVAYLFAGVEAADAVGTLTTIGCAGAFELAGTDQAAQAEVIYLRSTQSGPASEQVYRFEAAPTYQIQLQVTGQPQVIAADDQTYHLQAVWQPSTYSSLSVVLFVQDPEAPTPGVIYGLDVSRTAAGDAIGEYQLAADNAPPGSEPTAAEHVGLNPDLTLAGQHYVLVNVYTPVGTTRNGFMTLFATSTGATEMVLGRDQRDAQLLVFQVDPADVRP
jgi:hypothetical protein